MNKELLALLACPQCHSGLDDEKSPVGLYCAKCQLVYPVVDEIPVLLIDKAVKLGSPTTMIAYDDK